MQGHIAHPCIVQQIHVGPHVESALPGDLISRGCPRGKSHAVINAVHWYGAVGVHKSGNQPLRPSAVRQCRRAMPFRPVARSSVVEGASVAPPIPAAPAGECPVRHIMQQSGERLALEQQQALLGMQKEVVTPGPAAISIASLLDVSSILTGGIHKAMLSFSIKYGPVCR